MKTADENKSATRLHVAFHDEPAQAILIKSVMSFDDLTAWPLPSAAPALRPRFPGVRRRQRLGHGRAVILFSLIPQTRRHRHVGCVWCQVWS